MYRYASFIALTFAIAGCATWKATDDFRVSRVIAKVSASNQAGEPWDGLPFRIRISDHVPSSGSGTIVHVAVNTIKRAQDPDLQLQLFVDERLVCDSVPLSDTTSASFERFQLRCETFALTASSQLRLQLIDVDWGEEDETIGTCVAQGPLLVERRSRRVVAEAFTCEGMIASLEMFVEPIEHASVAARSGERPSF